MLYLCLIIWITYAFIEGKREGIFWHHRIKSEDYIHFQDIDRHPLFATQRALMLGALGFLNYYMIGDWLWVGYFALMNALIFSFFHNGAMYQQRNKMSVIVSPINHEKWIYKKKWWAQSTTSTAMLTKVMNPISRTIQAIIGVVGYIVYALL